MPTTSPDPESSHRQYWQMGLTLPIDDPFWNDHHPGDRWNCKCSLEATDEPVNRPDDMEPTKPQRGLENNPGKDGHTFNDSHPYFPKDCNHCPASGAKGFKNNLNSMFKNAKKDCYNCQKINNTLKETSTKADRMLQKQGMSADLARLRETTGKEYIDTLAKITNSKEFKQYPDLDNVFWMGKVKKEADLPRILDVAKKCVGVGYKVYILPNLHGIRTADLILVRNGIFKEFDLKTIFGSNSVDNDLRDSSGQTNRVLLNMVNTSYKPRRLAMAIKSYFESVPEAREVMIFKNKREISITRGYVKKGFVNSFMKLYNLNSATL